MEENLSWHIQSLTCGEYNTYCAGEVLDEHDSVVGFFQLFPDWVLS